MNIEDAKKIAYELHEGQFRSDGATPYIEHPKMVAELVERYGGSERCQCLAFLHDVLEENIEGFCRLNGCPGAYSKFKFLTLAHKKELPLVNDIIFDLIRITDTWESDQREIQEGGKVWYLSKLLITANHDVLLVKLCDMGANIIESAGSRLSQEKRYLKAVECLEMSERKDLTEQHKQLIIDIKSIVNRHIAEKNNEK